MTRALIVTADDFGASAAVNEAVEAAHVGGILTAASLMVAGAAAAEAIACARRLPKLGVGLHLVLVDGRPTLPPDRVPDLVDGRGRFHDNMALAGARFFFSPCVRRQLAAEIEAQFEAFAATGLPLDHVNAHKHFHLHPTILGLVIDIGRRFGLAAARAPVEPADVIGRVEPTSTGLSGRVAAPYARRARARLRAAGLSVPDQVFGLRWTGEVTADRVAALLSHLPDGVSELYTHPATGPYDGSAPGYRYRGELEALTSPAVRRAVDAERIDLGRFADFN